MESALVMFRPGGEHRTFKLVKDVVVVGRREDCDLRIPLGEISRKHSRLVKNGIGYSVEDMGSSNGTYVNGRRVQSMELEPGDTVQIGPVVFILQVDGEPAFDEMRPITVTPKKAASSDDSHGLLAGSESPTTEDEELAMLNDSSEGDSVDADVQTQIRAKK